jgi:hypothetical protein
MDMADVMKLRHRLDSRERDLLEARQTELTAALAEVQQRLAALAGHTSPSIVLARGTPVSASEAPCVLAAAGRRLGRPLKAGGKRKMLKGLTQAIVDVLTGEHGPLRPAEIGERLGKRGAGFEDVDQRTLALRVNWILAGDKKRFRNEGREIGYALK